MDIKKIECIRKEFPIFQKKNSGYLSYLDNAAITQVPNIVIQSLVNFYSNMNSNVHRGVYSLSELATESYEKARLNISKFIGANDSRECVFVKNTTEGINLVAHSFVKPILKKNDEILISQMEHHSNIVPWYLLCKAVGAKLKIIPILKSGDLDYNNIESFFTSKTKFLSVTHISNSLGTINNLKYLIKLSHSKGVPVLVDGAQSLSNCFINVNNLDCDFFVFSSHKVYGPNGLGVLYARESFLKKMIPFQGGGDMIKHVSFSNIIWNDIPYKFEAGTQSIANIIAFGSAIEFLKSLDLRSLFLYKKKLFDYTCNRLSEISGVRFIGFPRHRADVLSFIVENIHPHDVGTIANHYGVSIRTGHHCCIPVMNFFNVPATIRVSLGIYNLKKDIDYLIDAINEAKRIFS